MGHARTGSQTPAHRPPWAQQRGPDPGLLTSPSPSGLPSLRRPKRPAPSLRPYCGARPCPIQLWRSTRRRARGACLAADGSQLGRLNGRKSSAMTNHQAAFIFIALALPGRPAKPGSWTPTTARPPAWRTAQRRGGTRRSAVCAVYVAGWREEARPLSPHSALLEEAGRCRPAGADGPPMTCAMGIRLGRQFVRIHPYCPMSSRCWDRS